MLDRRYQKSVCTRGNYLHKFMVIEQTGGGILERCERCGIKKHFPNDISSVKYLEYHIRSILQASDPLFQHEYQNI